MAEGPDAFYHGSVAEAIATVSWLGEPDLAAHRSEWVKPLWASYRGVEVCELPPNGQGAAVLVGLGIAEGLDLGLHGEIEAVKVALDWAARTIGDAPLELPDVDELRARIDPGRALETRLWPPGGTTYLCAVDRDRNAVSFIQSTFHHFGSGVLAGDTGVVLQNRGFCFTEEEGHPNRIAPAKRPFHTIIPGLLLRDGARQVSQTEFVPFWPACSGSPGSRVAPRLLPRLTPVGSEMLLPGPSKLSANGRVEMFVTVNLAESLLTTPAGKLSDRVGSRWLVGLGMLLVTSSLLIFSTLGRASSFWNILPGLLVGGFGMALTMTPTTAAAMGSVPVAKAGVGSAVINSMRQVGGSLGIAVMGAVRRQDVESSLQDALSLRDVGEGGTAVLLEGL